MPDSVFSGLKNNFVYIPEKIVHSIFPRGGL